MATLYDTVRTAWPDLASVTDAQFDAHVDWARAHVSLDAFGDTYTTALVHLLAHQVSKVPGILSGTSGSMGVVGGVTQVRTGPLSKSYGGVGAGGFSAATPSDAYLMQTPAGQAFLSLRDTRPAAVFPMFL